MVRVSLTINNIYIWRVLKMAITAQMVKELRESTGAGMMDCKKALQEAEGNMERAVDILREKRFNQFMADEKRKEEIAESYERVAKEVYLSFVLFIKMCSIETK